jgi:outer membrane lipoprotein-sorting protein
VAALPHAVAGDALPSADELLGSVDKNLVFSTRTSTIHMTVIQNGRQRDYVMTSMSRGLDQSAIEYQEPARDRGTRMLRMAGDVWTYLPSVERVQKISGEMLRQGLMGSDLSYEDMMGSTSWRDQYTAVVVGVEDLAGRAVYRVELTARNNTVAYPRRVAWVDKETRIPVKQELYALSGMLLKAWDMTDIQTFEGGRRFPTTMIISDKLKQGSVTIIKLADIRFGVALEEEVFSMRWLERR